MTMNKLINDPDDVVTEALLGMEAAHPDLQVNHEHKIIHRGDAGREGKVAAWSVPTSPASRWPGAR